ncbi:MAG: hypothetical protein E7510_11635 [Ruminococcus sp.]|nr:hypothetical protein [Ruminococcus sp.]
MVKKISIITALMLTFYGVLGFWINIGNETLNSVVFVTIIIALILSPFAIAISVYRLSKDTNGKKIITLGIYGTIISAIDFLVLVIWFNKGNSNNSMYSVISGTIIALGVFMIISSATLFIITIRKKINSK